MTGERTNRADGKIGTLVQASQVHGDVHLHTSAPADARPPMMLPAPPRRLCDREDERTLLRRIATVRRQPARPDLLVISGPAGAGTTALALDVAHRAVRADAVPGGALWADLTPAPIAEPVTGQGPARQGRSRVDAALACWLRVLGAAWIPGHPDDAAALLRSLTASRPVVALIERAATAEQVRALLPAAGLVVVTSRFRLDLAADGAAHLHVPPLPEDAAVELATDLIGTRADEDPGGVRALVATCGALPGAVSAAAAYVAARPHRPIHQLAARLAPHPCTTSQRPAVTTDEEVIVNNALDTIYAGFPPDLQDAYRTLALMPGQVFSADAAAALLQLGVEATDTVLAGLRQAHMLEYEHEQDRWQMPAPVLTHATSLAAALPEDEQTAAAARVARHYLMWAAKIDSVIVPGRRRHAAVFGWLPERPPQVEGPRDAIALMQDWVQVLLMVQAAAADAGLHHLAWQYAEVLWGYVSQRQDYAAWQQVCEVALDSAHRADDPGGLARVHSLAGLLDRWLGRLDDAKQHHVETARLARKSGDTLAEASAAEHHGATLIRMRRHEEALQILQGGLALYQALPSHPRGEALLRRQLGIALSQLGHHDEASTQFTAAEAVFNRLGEPYPRSQLAVNQAEAAARTGRLDEALAHLDRAEEILPHRPVPHDAYLHYLRASLHSRTGDHQAAHQALATAIRLADRLPANHPTSLLIMAMADESSRSA
ncbi:tetratricopeptide repeat protein [Actinomadura geliboluensis]|uniref:Tetratricopeptide repeat protein n=1 Tax=Actinomadura geliboluensis TaxID=882440 RepID=A0A5S4GZ49_9ACTN|nr:tetratricopeptide repeat protein [Actinomadura geliboluensis]TMR38176.1 tetratricopeptide repeat protein [Actinomadura geliboluensis]